MERIDADRVPGRVHAGKRVLLDALRRTGKVFALEALESRRDSGAEGYPRWMHGNGAAGRSAGMERVVMERTKPRGRVKGRRVGEEGKSVPAERRRRRNARPRGSRLCGIERAEATRASRAAALAAKQRR